MPLNRGKGKRKLAGNENGLSFDPRSKMPRGSFGGRLKFEVNTNVSGLRHH